MAPRPAVANRRDQRTCGCSRARSGFHDLRGETGAAAGDRPHRLVGQCLQVGCRTAPEAHGAWAFDERAVDGSAFADAHPVSPHLGGNRARIAAALHDAVGVDARQPILAGIPNTGRPNLGLRAGSRAGAVDVLRLTHDLPPASVLPIDQLLNAGGAGVRLQVRPEDTKAVTFGQGSASLARITGHSDNRGRIRR